MFTTKQPTRSRPLVGSFEENVLNNRLNPIKTVDGYTAEVRASGKNFHPSPLKSGVKVSFFSAGDCFPYLGQIPIGRRGYKIPKKGTLQVALFNPNGTLVKLFVLFYDLTDMPPNSQTFLRQKTIFLLIDGADKEHNNHDNISNSSGIQEYNTMDGRSLENKDLSPSLINPVDDNKDSKQVSDKSLSKKNRIDKCQVRYLIQLNIVSSKSGRIYLNKDLRIFISKKVDLETASQIKKQQFELKAIDEMPSNPRYFSR